MNTAFHSLIGGIEAVTHFVKKQNIDRTTGRVATGAHTGDSQVTQDAITALQEVKTALLDAECDFMTSTANMEHLPGPWNNQFPSQAPPVAPGARTIPDLAAATDANKHWQLSFAEHCRLWKAVLEVQSAKFASAIYALQLQAPEWSALDRRLSQLMEDFKSSAEFTSGAGSGSPTWGSKMPPSGSGG